MWRYEDNLLLTKAISYNNTKNIGKQQQQIISQLE